MSKQQEIEKMAEIMQQGEIDREAGKIDCSEFALCAVVKNGMQRLAGATALINAGYGNVRAAVEHAGNGYVFCDNTQCGYCEPAEVIAGLYKPPVCRKGGCKITRPPQSFMYVEEIEE